MWLETGETVPNKILRNVASNVLRSVPPQNAFYFYGAIGAPTGAAARNLPDFLGILTTFELNSLQFHLGRRESVNLVKQLGDVMLEKQLGDLKEKNVGG